MHAILCGFLDTTRSDLSFLSGTLGTITFDVTKHVLDIVYSQTICWLAMFYAPLIVVITLLKSFVIFYIRLFYFLKVNYQYRKSGKYVG